MTYPTEVELEQMGHDLREIDRLNNAAPALYALAQAVAARFKDTDAPLGMQARVALALAGHEYEKCYACDEPVLAGEFHPCERPENCPDRNCPIGSTMVGWPHPRDLETCSSRNSQARI